MKVKITAIMIGMLIALAGLVSTSHAVDFSDGWKGCTPLVAGPNNGDVLVKLGSCNSGESGWGILSTTGQDQMLASFLTAMSLTKPVSVRFLGTMSSVGGFSYSKIVAIQLSNE